jgi:hypothetical protein
MVIKILLCGGILLSITGCLKIEESGLHTFDDFYAQIKAGKDVDCDVLVSTVGWVKAGGHQYTSHGVDTHKVNMHDYMLLSGNDFTSFKACNNEIEPARLTLCDEKNKIIEHTKTRQIEMSANPDITTVAGYSLSKAQFHYCKSNE